MSRRTVSPLQFAVLIVSAYLGAGIFQFPRNIVAIAGDNAPYAFLVEVGVALFGMWLWFQVNHIDPSKGVGTIAGDLAGPALALPLVLLTVALHLALLVYASANFALVLHAFFLDETPFAGLVLPVLLTAVAIVWNDLTPMARAIQIGVIPTMVLSFLMGLLVLPHAAETYAVVPGTNLFLGSVARAAYSGWYIFWGYELTVTLYPYIHPAERAHAERLTYIGMLLSAALFGFGYVVTIGAEGPYLLAVSEWPAVSAMRIINATAFLLNKLGLLVIVLWGTIVIAFAATRLWCLGHDVLPRLPKQSVAYYRAAILFFALVAFFWTRAFDSPPRLVHFAQSVLMPAMWVYNFLLPALILGLGWARSIIARRPSPSAA